VSVQQYTYDHSHVFRGPVDAAATLRVIYTALVHKNKKLVEDAVLKEEANGA
jgi:hypothetical protein